MARRPHGRGAEVCDGVRAIDRARRSIDPTKFYSDLRVQPADCFRIRSASVDWTLPRILLRGTSSATLVLAGRNLWRSTDYDGLDPGLRDESDQGASLARRECCQLPPSRQLLAPLRSALGNWTGAVADARQVPAGFADVARHATNSTRGTTRWCPTRARWWRTVRPHPLRECRWCRHLAAPRRRTRAG